MNNTALTIPQDLGIAEIGGKVYLFTNLLHGTNDPLRVGVSTDGLHFRQYKGKAQIVDTKGAVENSADCMDFRISHVNDRYILIYRVRTDSGSVVNYALSKDGFAFEKKGVLANGQEIGIVVSDYKHKDRYVMYIGETDIKVAYSSDLETWTVDDEAVLTPDPGRFDKYPLAISSIIPTQAGIVMVYYTKQPTRDGLRHVAGGALFDARNPKKVLWRKTTPLWEQPDEWNNEIVYPMGALKFQDKLILYFGIAGKSVQAAYFPSFDDVFDFSSITAKPMLKKHQANPIISPVLKHAWESEAVFNPAAIHEGGRVHLLYRAMGPSNTSVVGYASSQDGYHFDDRHQEPVYIPTEPFETPNGLPFFVNTSFMSGGGYGGVEDPRITKIDDTMYMTYVAFNGIEHPRVAMTSISVDNFLKKRFDRWAKPKLISRPGVVNKNAVLFPEKINGKYVMMHRVFPNILIDFLDDLQFDNPRYLEGHAIIAPRDNAWDSRKAGAGAPPLKTKDGWLLIYHAVDDREASQYKIGAMLLDLKDPTKVLYRSSNPILRPTEWYENEGYKSGVAYPCGAVIKDGKLIVYYGGADTVICAAEHDLDDFLDQLKETSPVKPEPVSNIHTVLKHIYA